MSNLEKAIEVAVMAHKGQTRKNGDPYILHPLRLMMSVESANEKIVAVLHDVVEDTSVSFEQLENDGFSDDVIAALKLLTHQSDQSYEDYINCLADNELSRKVKMADLRDNSNLFEIPLIESRDLQRLENYHKAYKQLENENRC